MDYQALLYDPIYLAQGVPAVLTLANGGDVFDSLTALDKTTGLSVGGEVEVQTVKPAACLRVRELASAGLTDLRTLPKARFTMNGLAWIVSTYQMKPSPGGEADGEVVLFLSQRRVLDIVSEGEP